MVVLGIGKYFVREAATTSQMNIAASELRSLGGPMVGREVSFMSRTNETSDSSEIHGCQQKLA